MVILRAFYRHSGVRHGPRSIPGWTLKGSNTEVAAGRLSRNTLRCLGLCSYATRKAPYHYEKKAHTAVSFLLVRSQIHTSSRGFGHPY
jgi:hypothetical protein